MLTESKPSDDPKDRMNLDPLIVLDTTKNINDRLGRAGQSLLVNQEVIDGAFVLRFNGNNQKSVRRGAGVGSTRPTYRNAHKRRIIGVIASIVHPIASRIPLRIGNRQRR